MDFTLDPAPDAATSEAVRVSVAAAGVGVRPGSGDARAAWWHAGVADAVDRAVVSFDPRPLRYDAALSPRSTRGATRA